VTGTPIYSRENLFEILGTPVKTCLKCMGTPVKPWHFGSRNYFKSDLLRLWTVRCLCLKTVTCLCVKTVTCLCVKTVTCLCVKTVSCLWVKTVRCLHIFRHLKCQVKTVTSLSSAYPFRYMLQSVAACCRVLQCVAVGRSELQYLSKSGLISVLFQCVAMCYSCFSMLQCVTVRCSASSRTQA